MRAAAGKTNPKRRQVRVQRADPEASLQTAPEVLTPGVGHWTPIRSPIVAIVGAEVDLLCVPNKRGGEKWPAGPSCKKVTALVELERMRIDNTRALVVKRSALPERATARLLKFVF